MLITQDLLKLLSQDLAPAQLCLIRVLGSDMEYVFRVRYKDVHLDYPVVFPLDITKWDKINYDEMHRAFVVMSKMVVPPSADTHDSGWCPKPEPAILAPQAPGKFHYEW